MEEEKKSCKGKSHDISSSLSVEVGWWCHTALPIQPLHSIPDEQKIIDQTETNLVAFRRTVYLTIQSSLDFEECAHKLIKMEIKAGYEEELGNMILDCCAQQRTYEKFFGLLAQVTQITRICFKHILLRCEGLGVV